MHQLGFKKVGLGWMCVCVGGGGCFSLKNISGYICIALSFRTSVCNCVVLREGHEVIFLSEKGPR